MSEVLSSKTASPLLKAGKFDDKHLRYLKPPTADQRTVCSWPWCEAASVPAGTRW
jgi:hypothetical protein